MTPVMPIVRTLALSLALVFERSRDKTLAPVRTLVSTRHVVLAVLAAMLVSGLLYSSFLTHPRGIVDSLSAYPTYLQRAVSSSWHGSFSAKDGGYGLGLATRRSRLSS